MFVHSAHCIQRALVSPTQRKRVLLAITALLGITLFASFLWSAVTEYDRKLDQRLEIRSMEYRNLQQLISSEDHFADQAEYLQAFLERLTRDHLVRAASPPLSEAMFQNIVNDLTSAHQVDVVSMRMMPRSDRDGVVLLRLAITARADINAIRDFLLAVENNPRMLFFEELEIRQISQNERRFYHFNAHLAAVTKH
ncbi:MAG: hypothetical protein EA399_14640 [Desulfovibrionales bacterium]|nr:MAG: hypothetical protein EA399_14640 [Desulfovibrionales bacterium]